VFVSLAAPGSDLSYLLFKHPGRVQEFDLSYGRAFVWYPRADEVTTEAALWVDVDATALARSKRFRVSGFELGHYVNDRAYAASSLLAGAIGRVFRSALRGQDPAERPGTAAVARELTLHLPSLRARGGAAEVGTLFEPLGYTVGVRESVATCVDVTLRATTTVQLALSQLYVLLPVLDDAKHYWVGEEEIDKLVRHGEPWLAGHPARDLIMARYLAHQRAYVADATARLLGEETLPETAAVRLPNLAEQRRDFLVETLRRLGARRILDLGCGEGRLVRALLDDPAVTVTGADVAPSALAQAERRLERLAERQRERVTLIQASATYRDNRFAGHDAIVASEVVEHLDPDRLPAFEATVFAAGPTHVVVTTPNADYNPVYGLAPGERRHADHRFEWSRAEFAGWAEALAARHGYTVTLAGVGDPDLERGQPTQAALFSRGGE
jgi:3' terminal RNA ribose 2'-O-methyltransferase Hen1